jgi:hypothetical protein
LIAGSANGETFRVARRPARRAVARRAGILDTKVDTDAGQAAEKRPVARRKSPESFGGPSRTRTWSQWIKNPLLYRLS